MGTVEDLCDHIALINKSKKILDGSVDEVRENYKSNIFEVIYKGDFQNIQHILGNSFSILEHEESDRENQIRIQHLDGVKSNDLIRMLLGSAEIISFREEIPSMNDVFIKVVKSYNEVTE
jgi:ABC-2 type transport system ATP-binding protein